MLRLRLHSAIALLSIKCWSNQQDLRTHTKQHVPAQLQSRRKPLQLQVDVPPEDVERKGRLMPGNIFLVDFERHAVVTDEEMKHAVATKRPYGKWLATQTVTLQVRAAFAAFFHRMLWTATTQNTRYLCFAVCFCLRHWLVA